MGRTLRLIIVLLLSLGVVVGISACSKPASLTDLTMAKSLDDKTQDPVEKATVFAPSTDTIYASVKLADGPSGTKVKAVWLATDVPGIDKGKAVQESTVETSGSRSIGFSLSKSAKRWPTGKYSVQVFLADKVAATTDFVIESKATLSEVTLTKEVDAKTQEPLAKTVAFTPSQQKIYCTTKISDAPPKTEVKAVWTVQDVPGNKKGEIIDQASVETEGTRYLSFSLSKSSDRWPTGKYSVALFIDDNQVATADFAVDAPTVNLTEVTMAKSVDSSTKEPKEKTSVFADSAAVIYCTVKLTEAPANTDIKASWTVNDVSGVEKGYIIDEATVTTSGTRYVSFSLSKESDKWATGKYTVKLSVNGKQATTIDYTIQATSTPGKTPTPSKSTDVVSLSETTMAKSVDPVTQEPKQKTTSFTPTTDVLYCVTKVNNAPIGTQVTAVWLVSDIPGYDKGDEIDEASLDVDGTEYLVFSLTRGSQPWPVGKYSVQLYVDDEQVTVINFSIAN